MAIFRRIEILNSDNNKKGDIFGRLMGDLFHSLGYDEPRLNIHKSGREVDIQAFHRTEKKIAIAECKAHKETIGGDDINKFIGVLDVECRKIKKEKQDKHISIIGYYISLSGFKESAIEQETDIDNNRVILIKPSKIVEELIQGRIIVPIENAISTISTNGTQYTLSKYADLMASDRGWVWTLYYSANKGQKDSHFAFVHADGKPLINELAQELILLDQKANKLLSGLRLIPTLYKSADERTLSNLTTEKYFKYLENECGEIQFEGLPTDKEAGSVRVKLESIFVPLYLSLIGDAANSKSPTRTSMGAILKDNKRIAILAKPGGGKSTLIKRIAIAYAFPDRRKSVDDELPNYCWFPIFIRCRELGEKVTQSITEIINNIPLRAEISDCQNGFSKIISDVLQNGSALLLIDGLDEISEDRNRISFVNQLRTFLATYPNINIIVTSREAGFRAVAGMLATYCSHFKVANLAEGEIEELTIKWHKAIIDETENTTKEAQKITNLIIKDSRIKVLAENPLLLTTLLFVRRWAGYLPTKRTVLYQEMIKLLLVTWNVEGHDQLDIEEAEPQLSFVAYWMTKNGQQTITEEELKACLIESRKQMPEILGYTKISPTDFIKRVESRSSLLILSGHKRTESGTLTQLYEFLHLSFQEYLTAKAIVKKYLPFNDSSKNHVEIISPNINNENWKEVIPITAVLLERDAKKLIELLICESEKVAVQNNDDELKTNNLSPNLLGNCIANEIQIGPEILDIAIEWFAKNNYNVSKGISEVIFNSKFKSSFVKQVTNLFYNSYDDKFASPLGSLLSEISTYDINLEDSLFQINLKNQLEDPNKRISCTALLIVMSIGWQIATNRAEHLISFQLTDDLLKKMMGYIEKNDRHYRFSACWAFAWVADAGLLPRELFGELFRIVLPLWLESSQKSISRVAAWVLIYVVTPQCNITVLENVPDIKELVNEKFNNPSNEFDKKVALYIGILLGINRNGKEVAGMLKTFANEEVDSKRFKGSLNLFIKHLNINLNHPDQFELKF